jgi:hypothetical protein
MAASSGLFMGRLIMRRACMLLFEWHDLGAFLEPTSGILGHISHRACSCCDACRCSSAPGRFVSDGSIRHHKEGSLAAKGLGHYDMRCALVDLLPIETGRELQAAGHSAQWRLCGARGRMADS